MRGKRHKIELTVKDLNANIASQKKNYETLNKKIKIVEENLKKAKIELEEYQVCLFSLLYSQF